MVSQGNPYGRSAPLHNTQYTKLLKRLVGKELYYSPCQPEYYTILHNTKTNYTMKNSSTLKKQRARLERTLAKKLLSETRDTLSAILRNERKTEKTAPTLPFPIQEIQVHLLDEDGEGMVIWLQGSIEKGKVHIEKGFEELTDHEAIEATIEVELEESDEEEDHMIEEMFTTVGKKPVLLN